MEMVWKHILLSIEGLVQGRVQQLRAVARHLGPRLAERPAGLSRRDSARAEEGAGGRAVPREKAPLQSDCCYHRRGQ